MIWNNLLLFFYLETKEKIASGQSVIIYFTMVKKKRLNQKSDRTKRTAEQELSL